MYYSFKNNGLEYEKNYYFKYKPCSIVDFEIIKCKKIKKSVVYEIIDELIEKVVSCELINDQKDECCEITDELIEKVVSSELINEQKDECNESTDQKDECCKLINNQEVEIIKDQKVEDIKMPKSSKNESDKIKELGLTMQELKVIARKRGVKNYENLSRIELVKEIDKLEPEKELQKKKITSSLLSKQKKYEI